MKQIRLYNRCSNSRIIVGEFVSPLDNNNVRESGQLLKLNVSIHNNINNMNNNATNITCINSYISWNRSGRTIEIIIQKKKVTNIICNLLRTTQN